MLPRIRADIAKELVKMGLSQKEAAKKLGVTPSAVSQYLHKKRGGKAKMPKDYGKMVEATAEKLLEADDEAVVLALLCRCCSAARR